MGYKKGLIFMCLIICLFSITSVCAGNVNETIIMNGDISSLKIENTINQSNEIILTMSNDEKVISESANDNSVIDGNNTIIKKGMCVYGNNVTLKNYNITCYDQEYGALTWKGDNGKIINCTFINCKSSYGGTVTITGKNCTIINCTFSSNLIGIYGSGGAIIWEGSGGNIINSTFVKNICYNDAGVILGKTGSCNIINCTFSDNKASKRGGVLFLNKATSWHIINSIFFNNVASGQGGAIYTYGGTLNVNNCKFIENHAQTDGGAIYANGNVLINNTIFLKNHAEKNGAIYGGGGDIRNSIFLDNVIKSEDKFITSSANFEYDWFGNTFKDYNAVPNVAGTLKNWLFLNATHERLMLVGDSMHVPFVFQLWNGTDILDYDSSKIYPVELNLSATNGEINKITSVVGEDILYNASAPGIGTITAEFFDKKLTVNLTCKNPTEIAVSEPIIIYVDQFMNFTGDVFFAILNPGEAGALNYSTDNENILTLNSTGFKGINEGNANVLIEFKETDEYASANASVPVTVIRYDTQITANNTINIDFGESSTIDAILTPNIGNLVYHSLDANVATVDKNGLISTVNAGTTNIAVKFEGDRKYKPSNKTIALTVNKIDSNILIYNDFIFNYGNSATVATSVKGIKGINAFVVNHPEAKVNFNNNRITVSNLNVGNYILSVTTIPDNNHNAVATTADIAVKKVDSLMVIPEIIFDYGSSTSVNPTVKGVTGITDVQVINHPEANIIVKNNMFEISNLAIGTYTLTATTVPDSNHNAVTNTAKITVNKPDSSIEFTKEIIFDYGSSDYTTVILNGATGITNVEVINHPEAIVNINNDRISVSGLDEGTYTLTATTVPDSNHNAVTNTIKITVLKYDSSIVFTNDLVFDYGGSASTKVILNGATGITNVEVINHPEAVISIKNNVISVSGLNAGSYTLAATTMPDKSYYAVIGTAEIQVNKIDSRIKFTKNLVFTYDASDFKSFILDGVIDLDISVINHPEAYVSFDKKYISLYDLDAGNYKFSITTIPDKNHNSITIKVPFKVNKLNTKLTVKKTKGYTISSTLKATVKDVKDDYVNEGVVKFTINGKTYKAKVNKGVAKVNLKLSKAKTYSYKATFVSNNFYSKTASSKLVVKQSRAKISLNKVSCISGDYFTLKAIVKNSAGKKLDDGFVKFSINGKKYKIYAYNGVATKKLKLSKIKTYTYKAVFSSKYYKSKVYTSKVVIKKQPVFKIKIGKYSIKVSYKDYKKIKKAKSNGRFIKKYDTGKTINYKVYTDEKITKTKKKLYSYGTYTTYYIPNSDALIAPPGYYYAGKQFTVENGIEKVYMVYKKTSYKKVLVKTPKTKVYIYIESTPWGTSANLYHLKSVYEGEYIYYSGNYKSIF